MSEKETWQQQPEFDSAVAEHVDEKRSLILHNDDVNTFDFVIDSLIKICKMDEVQAEQCTLLVHYKGKCDVKSGTFNYLKPYKTALTDKGLEATIE